MDGGERFTILVCIGILLLAMLSGIGREDDMRRQASLSQT